MEIIITIASIFVISAIAWFLRRMSSIKICPICAGVAGTWIWMFVGMLAGQLSVISYQLLVGILMGGSVVGIAYQLEKRQVFSAGGRIQAGKLLLWKTLFIPVGFIAVYGLLFGMWFVFAAALGVLTVLVFVFLRRGTAHQALQNEKARELEKEMEKCC